MSQLNNQQMKKGDIVKLKSGEELRDAEIHWNRIPAEKIQELYTVQADASYQRTGCADEVELVVELEGFNPRFYMFEASFFEVALPAGQPDVDELMKQVEAIAVTA